jgi:hypothetical protein
MVTTAMQALLVCKRASNAYRTQDGDPTTRENFVSTTPGHLPFSTNRTKRTAAILCSRQVRSNTAPRPVLYHRPTVSPAGPVLRRPSPSALPSLARLDPVSPSCCHPPPISRSCMLSLSCCPSGQQLTCPSHCPSPPVLCHPSPVRPTARLHRSSATQFFK